ncbi:MAG TPA: site-2 protease family protein [Terriglobales bacterium]|nr:site-2 protease family protein [Terriglobales bacterium]
MQDFLITIVSVGFVLGIMILVHEFGHYAVAKLLGVRVEVFSIGFGKRLWGFRRGDTDYRISVLPLGGYVRMAGESPLESRTGDPGEFMSHPRWHRFLIVTAGPAMNLLLAVGLLTAVYMVRYEYLAFLDDKPPVVGWVGKDSAAAKAGVRPGDRITRIENVQHPGWDDLLLKVSLSPSQPVELAVQRGGETLNLSMIPATVGPSHIGDAGWIPEEPIQVGRIESGMPADRAGIKAGDQIVALNGTSVHELPAEGNPRFMIEVLIYYMQQNKEKPLEIAVLRGGQEMKFNVTPVMSDLDGSKRYRIGFAAPSLTHVNQLPPVQAFVKSIEDNRRYTLLIVELVQKMVQRKVSFKQIEGPISIARASGDAARQRGWTPLLQLMAAISLNLGILNLFPIPILDGGVLLLLMIEGTLRRDISIRIKERIYQAAFVFLVLFAVMVIYNDLGKLPVLSRYLP